jgi:hypothetical protein
MSTTAKPRIRYLWIGALVLSTLACRAATRLVIRDTPTPAPTATPTPTPTLTPTPSPTLTPTIVVEAACSPLLAQILETYATEVVLDTERTDETFQGEDGTILITYEVSGDQLSNPRNRSVSDELRDWQQDRAAHESIWNYFVSIIPAEQRSLLSEYFIFTDGRGNHLAGVSPARDDPNRWVLHVDILDSESYYDLTYTLLHEQGHLLTLGSSQVTPSEAIFEHPSSDRIYQQEVEACPQYFTGEGCSLPDSYINQFFTRFWPYLYDEWEQIDLEEDEAARAHQLHDFYKTYQDQFLTDYAVTSPAEDIAESWTFFVLSPKPELTSIANEKILFFYEYPELVELRTQILEQVCVEFPR